VRNRRVFACASTVATIVAAFVISAPAGAASNPSTVALSDSVSPAAAASPSVGAVPGSSSIDFEVELKLPDLQGAQAFAQAVSTPGSTAYGRYLTAAQWEQRFSPSTAEVRGVRAFLTQNGFKVLGASADRMAISASGTAAQVQRAFATSLSYHRVDGSTLRLADRDLSVPSDIAAGVAGVSGVSDTLAHPDNLTGDPGSTATASSPSAVSSEQPAGFRVAPPCGTYYGQQIDTTLAPFGNGYPSTPPWAVCGYAPPQLRSAYDLSGAADGSGITVAVVDAYASPTIFSDAQHYASLNDPSHPLAAGQFSQTLASSFTDAAACGPSGWYGEETLDVEAVHATAPGAHILFAGARNCNQAELNDAVRHIVDGHLASVITNSYGDNGGDVFDDAGTRAATDNTLLLAAATGVSVLFSSGDGGDEFTTVGAVVADYPSSSPWATAVGGTSLQIGASGQRLGEFGWSTARSFLCNETFSSAGGCTDASLGKWLPIDQALDGGSGGGTSYVYPQPFYQRGVVPAALSQRNSAVVGNDPMRVEPDISMEADPATGFLVGETQTFPNGVYYDQYRIGGTSVSSPLLAGVIARADEVAGHSLGFVNPSLYSLLGNSNAVYDVQAAGKQDQSRADYANSIGPGDGFFYSTRIIDYEGQEMFCTDNGSCSARDVALSTAPGFDSMTGLGAPTGNFVNALASR
jgi:subtilase family serine protease